MDSKCRVLLSGQEERDSGTGDGVGLRREEGVAWFCSGRGLVFKKKKERKNNPAPVLPQPRPRSRFNKTINK